MLTCASAFCGAARANATTSPNNTNVIFFIMSQPSTLYQWKHVPHGKFSPDTNLYAVIVAE